MAPFFHQNTASDSTAISENFRRELRDFQVFHANMRAEEEKKSKKLFDELSNATKRRFETNGSRNDPISAIQRDDAIERASLTKDLENRIGSRAREEWYARLDRAGLSAEQWTDVTPAENDVLSGLLWGRNDAPVPAAVTFNEESSAHTPSMASRGPQLWTPPESARAELPAPGATVSISAQGQRVAYYNNTPTTVALQLQEQHLKSPHLPLHPIHSPPQSQSQALPRMHPRRNTVASSAPAQIPIASTNSTTKMAAPTIPQDGLRVHPRSKGPAAKLSDVNEDDQDTETELTYKTHISSRKSSSLDSKVIPIRAEPPKVQPRASPPNQKSETIPSTSSMDVGIPFPTPPESTLTTPVPLPSETEPDAEWKASLRSKIEEKLRPVINDARAHNNHDLSDMSSIAEGLYQDELAQERRRLVEMQAREETRLKNEGAKQKAEEQKSVQKQTVSLPTTQKASSSQPTVQKTVVSQPTVQKHPLSQSKQAGTQSPVQSTAKPQPSIQKQASPPIPAQNQASSSAQTLASPPVQKPPSPTALRQVPLSAQKPTTTPAQRPTAAPAQKPVSAPVQKTASSQSSLQKQAVPQKPVVSQPVSQKPQPSTQKQSVSQTPIQKQAVRPPVQKQTASQKPVATSASSPESKTTEQITPPPTPGTRYIGPELTSEEKDKEEAAFDAFLLTARRQKIIEFHEAAAMMEVKLADELHTHRLVGSQLKAVLKKHDNDMLKLKERMEQERKAMCDAEKARRVAELGVITRDVRSAGPEDSQSQATQKTRVRSDTIRPNRPEDQAEKPHSVAGDATGSPIMSSTTSSAEVPKVAASPSTNNFQPQVPPTPIFSPQVLEAILIPTTFAVIEKRDDSTFVPPTPQNSPRPLDSPRKVTAPTLPVEQQHSPSSSSDSSLDRFPPTPRVADRPLIDEPMVAPPSVIQEASPRQEQHYQSGPHQFSNITPVTPSMTLPQIYDSLSTDDEEDLKRSIPITVSRKQVRFTPSAVGRNSDSDSDLNSDPELDERARALRNTLGLGAGYDTRVSGERRAGHGDAASRNRKRGPSRGPTAAPLMGKMELPEIWYPPPEEKTMGRSTPGSPLTSHHNWNEWS